MILLLFIIFEPSTVTVTEHRLKLLYSKIFLCGMVLFLKLNNCSTLLLNIQQFLPEVAQYTHGTYLCFA